MYYDILYFPQIFLISDMTFVEWNTNHSARVPPLFALSHCNLEIENSLHPPNTEKPNCLFKSICIYKLTQKI